MSKVVLTTLLAISLTGLATMVAPSASAVTCPYTMDPRLGPVVQTCWEAFGTASETLGPYLDEVHDVAWPIYEPIYEFVIDQLP